jgi:hypothetical protein
MRQLKYGAAFVFLLLTGCSHFPWTRSAPDSPGLTVTAANPTAADLIASLNDNARRVQALECRALDMDCTQKYQSISLQANMVCQKPRNFRLGAKILGNTGVDMGSNDSEFWYWISKAEPPYLVHCSYQDLATGQVRMPFPFQPDWIMEALGIAEMDPAKNYELIPRQGKFELVERTVSPQGQQVRKVTVIARTRTQYQVTAHLLQDVNGKEICSAYVSEVQQDPTSGALLPRVVQLLWPAEQMKMKMRLSGITVNPGLPQERVARLFTRPTLRDVPSYDLARGLDGGNDPIRRARGSMP